MNKFRQNRAAGVPPKAPIDLPQIGFGGGFRADAASLVLPLETASEFINLRVEREGLRKDYGYRAMSSAAGAKIIALGYHRFWYFNAFVTRAFRAFIEGGKLKVQWWFGASWQGNWVSVEDVPETMLSWTSLLDSLLIADGTQILRLGVDIEQDLNEEDFTAAETIDAETETTSVTISPAGATGDFYTIYYNVSVAGADPIEFELELLHNGDVIGNKVYSFLASELPITLADESFSLIREITSGDTLAIRMKRIDSSGTADIPEQETFTETATSTFEATLSADGAWDDKYYIGYNIFGAAVIVTNPFIEIYVDTGAGYVFVESFETGPSSGTYEFVYAGLATGDKIKVVIQGDIDAANSEITTLDWTRRVASSSTPTVRGNNKATTGDLFAGVEYYTRGTTTPVFSKLPLAPAAYFVFNFGDRAVALGDRDNEKQSLAWSADGDVTDWAGGDSGQIYLLETRNDPVDALVAGAPVGGGIAVLYRRRSIMRVFETGNTQQAIGAVHWIEGIGTESPHSVQIVPGGNMFLGHDLVVYYLTENGETVPVGMPIQQELINANILDLTLIDSAYDPIAGEYYLAIPEDGAEYNTTLWILDFKRFRAVQELQWRQRNIETTRIAVAGALYE